MTLAIALSTQNARRLLGPGPMDVGPFLDSPQVYRRAPATEARTNASGMAAIMFGAFCLLPTQRLLLEADEPVRLGSRALDILIALIERHGELVTKKDLMARVWPGITVVEANLAVHISALRRALRDGQAGQSLPHQHSRAGLPLCRADLDPPGAAARVVMGPGNRTRFRHAGYAGATDWKRRRGPETCLAAARGFGFGWIATNGV